MVVSSRVLALASFVLLIQAASAQSDRASWRERWEATAVRIPMRDGVKLHTVFFVPKDKEGPFPILMERTPYGAGTAGEPPNWTTPKLVEAGYVFAYQDVRGTGQSEGTFIDVRPILPAGRAGTDESTDTYDTIEYLVKNVPGNSGRVGLWGISYPGFYAGAGAVRGHPALKAVSPQAPVNDWFLGDDVHHRGAFFLQETFDFIQFFNVPRGAEPVSIDRRGVSAYDFFLRAGPLATYDEKFFMGEMPYWQELVENDTYNAYWKERALWRSFRDVSCAVLTVGGWFDKEDMWGALNLYKAAETQNPGIHNHLVMGPWSHGGWADRGGSSLSRLAFGSPTSNWYRDNVEFPFFERFLRGDEGVPAVPEATMFETGANVWRTFPQWPPKGRVPRSAFLHSKGGLAWMRPSGAGATAYVYDPAKPTPYLADFETNRRAPGDWLARDQRFLDARKDQATFRMAPFDKDLRVAGPIDAEMWITTTGTDADLVVQIIDEYPKGTPHRDARGEPMDGYQLMVRGEIIRAKFRDSWEKPSPIVPGKPTRVRLQLNDVLHTFQKGHRLVVRVQSAWFPIADRNPNAFVSRAQAKESDFVPATIRVLSGGDHASRVTFGELR